ncbi:hypothetical protein [Methanolobus sp. WCC5]|jgi:hypothetical protein|uniref:hypothetical protein n=1 Tax=Methanolobus sp. WCC5 TaxID=3125785 RepID=UPI00324CB9DA
MDTRRFTLIAVALMLVSLFAVTAMAADQIAEQSNDQLEDGSCPDFIDEDGDGICDNFADGAYKGLGNNCKGTGACDGTGPDRTQDRIRERSCQN